MSRVRFVRASISDYESLEHKDPDTLYFVNVTGSFEAESLDTGGLLYLGEKLIDANPNQLTSGDGIVINGQSINIKQDAYWQLVTFSSISRTYIIAASAHGKGTEPIVTCFESSNFKQCYPDIIIQRSGQSAGNVTIQGRSSVQTSVYVKINGFYSDEVLQISD